MPIVEFECPVGHKFEKVILSSEEAAKAQTSKCNHVACDTVAKRVVYSMPSPPNLPGMPGDGFHKPSAIGPITGKHDVTKVVSEVTSQLGTDGLRAMHRNTPK